MKFVGFFICLTLVLGACNPNENSTKKIDLLAEQNLLLETDKDFSQLSVQKGMKAAFIEYIDSNGVLLRPGKIPIIGAHAIDYLIQINDTSYSMNWEPQKAVVSESADLGYTYGLYAVHPNEKDTIMYGTYVSIWKKQKDGSWKFVLDSGNAGADEDDD